MIPVSDYQNDGRTVYHTRRPGQRWSRDRQQDVPADAPRRRSRNRSLVIIMIDVAVILLIYAVVSTLLNSESWRGTIEGVEAELHVQTDQQQSVWELRLTRRRDDAHAMQNQIVTVTFFDEGGHVSQPVLDLLPPRAGERRILEYVGPPAVGVLRAHISVNAEQLQLKRRTADSR